ncbi:MAG TPA: glucose-1-phosphate cytidylyltransferase [Chloroflexota bacterium]|nr:glucose-1-phosphate cytidylyltransferase [Chloroflexota bacterium]
MKVVILCGGMGTRLREETEFMPKPMVTVGERPMLWHIMKIYSHYGFNEFVLCLGYKGDHIRRYFLEYDVLNCDVTVDLGTKEIIRHDRTHDEHNWRVTLAETGQATMTGGRIQRALRYVDDDTFLATYGDGVADVNINALVAFHRSHGRLATVTAVQPSPRFGRIELDDTKQLVREFSEKPVGSEAWINGGFFVFDRRITRYLDGDSCVLEQGPLVRLAEEGQLAVFRHRGYWQCVDTLRDLQALNDDWARGDAPWKIW